MLATARLGAAKDSFTNYQVPHPLSVCFSKLSAGLYINYTAFYQDSPTATVQQMSKQLHIQIVRCTSHRHGFSV